MSRSRIWVLAVAGAFAAGGCLTITPAGSPGATLVSTPSPGAGATADPGRTRRPRRTRTPAQPTAPATDTPTTLPTAPPTDTPTTPPTAPPTAASVVDLSLPAVYGSTSLTAGFTPDPHSISATGGGPVDVAYLGSLCTGFVTAAPTYELVYTSGAFPTLRFYFVAGLARDSTLVVNTPSGEYLCADDSFGTVHPTIDVASPASGTYDIWVGAFVGGTDVAGSLSITEGTDNHP